MHGPRTPHADAVHATKYRQPGEDFREAVNRWAFALKDDDAHYHVLRDVFGDMRFLPPGRTQSAIGAVGRETTAYNCFVSRAIEDSFVHGEGSIMDAAKEAAATMRMGGGIGYDFSTLRPRGDAIRKLQSSSSGPVSFMRLFNEVCLATSSSGHRRGAQMGVMRVDHPDIVEFVGAKQPTPAQRALWQVVSEMPADHPLRAGALAALQEVLPLQGFNVSVGVTDEFMEAVHGGKMFALRFGGREYREVDAAELWEKIMRSTWDWAEPGVLFLDRINEMNNLWYCETIAATNPCVPEGTPILTSTGWRAIEDCLEEKVLVWNGVEFAPTTPRVTGLDQPLVTVRLTDGSELTCTEAHRFILIDGTRAEARQLVVGDDLLPCDWPVVDASTVRLPRAYAQGFFSGDGWLAGDRPYISFKKDAKRVAEERLAPRNAYDTSGGYRFLYMRDRLYTTDKSFVPGAEWDVRSRLDWFAGLCDADGTAIRSYDKDGKPSSVSISVGSVDQSFVDRVALMLKTLGVRPTTKVQAGHGYANSRDVKYLLVAASELVKLQGLGIEFSRLDVTNNNPNRSAHRKLLVAGVESAGVAPVVYCFTEERRHAGCFNGVLTGQCGEQPLPPFGACLLGSFNLVKYLERKSGRLRMVQGEGISYEITEYDFDFDQLRADVAPVVRAMDNVVDRTRYPLARQRAEAVSKRRMGLGVTGLANAGEALGHPYGSPAFVAFAERVLTVIRDESYRASANLAREKGAFPMYDDEKYLCGRFVATLPDDIRHLMSKHGVRNSHLTSIAPTGTISFCADNVSSGLEPVLYHEQERVVNMPDGPRTVVVEDYGAAQLGVRGRLAEGVTPGEHVAVLCAASALVDSAVSKTCNVDGRTPWAEFKELYATAHRGGAKGLTTFNADGSRTGIIRAAAPREGDSCEVGADGRRSCG